MEQPTQNPAPDDEPTWTLLRFCRSRRLALNIPERSAVGVELSRLVRERQLPLRKVREQIAPGQWSKSRLYPESLLCEWFARYTQAKAQATASVPSPDVEVAAHG